MLKLKFQCFGHLMQRADSLESLMLGKIEGRRRRGQQRTRWLDGSTDSTDMNLSKLWEIMEDRGAGWVWKSWTWLSDSTATTDINLLIERQSIFRIFFHKHPLNWSKFSVNISRQFFKILCGPCLTSLLNLLQYCFDFMFWFFGLVMWDLSPLTRDRKSTGPPGKWGVPFLGTHLYQEGSLLPDPLVSWKSLHFKSFTEASGKPIATQVKCKCRQKAVYGAEICTANWTSVTNIVILSTLFASL